MKTLLFLVLAFALSGCGSTLRFEHETKAGTMAAEITLPKREGFSK